MSRPRHPARPERCPEGHGRDITANGLHRPTGLPLWRCAQCSGRRFVEDGDGPRWLQRRGRQRVECPACGSTSIERDGDGWTCWSCDWMT